MSCHHSHVLNTVSQTNFCGSPASPTPSVESSQYYLSQTQQHLLSHFSRRQRSATLSPPSPPHRYQRQLKQQQLQLKIQQQLQQQSLQKHQQWQQIQQWQQSQQWHQQYQNPVLPHQHHHDLPTLNDNANVSGILSNFQQHSPVGCFAAAQQSKSPEVMTRDAAAQQEYEYTSAQVKQNDMRSSGQFLQQFQHQHDRTFKPFQDVSRTKKELFPARKTCTKEPDVAAPTPSLSFFNHITEEQSTSLMSELSLEFLNSFQQFSLNGQIDVLKTSDSKVDDKINTFSYFTLEPNANFNVPTILCSTNIDSFVNPLEAAPDICQDARPKSRLCKITIPTRPGEVSKESKNDQDKSSDSSLCGLNKLQVLSEIQNLELITSPKFNDFPQNLKSYLLSERMILADVRSIIDSQYSDSDALQSSNESNVQEKSTEETTPSENKTYANILQSTPPCDLNSSKTSDEHSCENKQLPIIKRSNRRPRSTNRCHNVTSLKSGLKKSNHNELTNSASALEKRKRTKVPYKIRKPGSTNKNSKFYNDSWRVDAVCAKKRD